MKPLYWNLQWIAFSPNPGTNRAAPPVHHVQHHFTRPEISGVTTGCRIRALQNHYAMQPQAMQPHDNLRDNRHAIRKTSSHRAIQTASTQKPFTAPSAIILPDLRWPSLGIGKSVQTFVNPGLQGQRQQITSPKASNCSRMKGENENFLAGKMKGDRWKVEGS